MVFDEITRLAIHGAIERGLPFAAYMMPGGDEVVFFSDPGEAYAPAGELCFAVNVWCGGSADEYGLKQRADAKATLDYLTATGFSAGEAVNPWAESTDEADYIDSVDELIGRLQSSGGKTVMSRVICGRGVVDWVDVAEKYFTLHPEAFRYIYQTPRHGCWLGASPELLVKVADGRFTTMALAGTREIIDADKPWNGKNIAEQAIVRDYIVDRLFDIGLNPEVHQTETVTTGNLQHLRSIIDGDASSSDVAEIISALNPTPALAGYPLHTALENIVELERHPRRCYGAYIMVRTSESAEAYVNLRCVNFDTENWCMYVGGGIMPDSDSEDEWRETEAKSKILYQLIEGSRK